MIAELEYPLDLESVERDFERVLAPWEENRYRLISWWEMQQFSGYMIFWSGYALESIISDCLMNCGPGDEPLPVAIYHKSLDDRTLDRALRFLPHVERECRNVGLVIAAGTVQEAIERLGDEKRPDFWWLKERSAEIRKIIHKEMAGRAFLYLPPEKAQFFATEKKPHVFGDAVAKAFPSAVFDISEAGACLATARPTACVFHLMRVLESGLTVLGKKFGVSLAHTNWAPAIEEIESKIREMHKDPTWKVLPDCKQQQEFYAQAATHFGILKDAWRNYTMHNRGKYTEDEAEQIFKNTKSFMAKLSERLAE